MFNWFIDKQKTSIPATTTVAVAALSELPISEDEQIKQALADMNLLFSGTQRIAPQGSAEEEFASRFNAWAKDCRTTFAELSFDLPTLPSSAVRLMSLMQNPDISSKEIARTLQGDVVLTARFLRMANSPVYRGTRQVDSVIVAIDRIGIATLKGIVLALSLNSTVIKEKRLGAAASELWNHSISAGLAAQELAKRLHLNHASAFTLGLMHDIGKIPTLIMLNTLRAAHPSVRPALLETLVEDNHCEIGMALAEVWKMPGEVRLIAGCHHAVSTLEDTLIYINHMQPGTPLEEGRALAKLLGCVVLADRSLAALGLAREPGDLTVGDSGMAADLGLSVKETMDYLRTLPSIIKESNLKEL